MKWNRYSIKTTTAAIDLLSSALDDIGIEGIEIQDNVQLTQEEAKTMFVDFIPELPPDDGTAVVNFYIDSEEDDGTLVKKAEQEIEDLRMFVDVGDGTITRSETEDKDWINNWKQYWHTFSFDTTKSPSILLSAKRICLTSASSKRYLFLPFTPISPYFIKNALYIIHLPFTYS